MKKRRKPTRPASAPFSLLVKPAGPDCNLRCTYCFYLKKAALFADQKSHRMSDDVLEALISGYMATEQPVYSFGWQGGEPTLMGLDFFKKVVALQQQYGRPGTHVANGLQTNATLIDDEFAEHLAAYSFLLGVSVDGPAEMHDRYRLARGGGQTHETVMRSIDRLRGRGVEVNALTLVSKSNVGDPDAVYDFLRSKDLNYMQFIPCVEFAPDGSPAPFSITGEEWGQFLLGIFERWYPNDVRTVSIRHHDALMGFFLDGSRHMCTMGGRCDAYFVVEHTGDVYPCDFYVEPALRLGNITTDSWQKLSASPVRSRFAGQKGNWASVCQSCEHLPYCSGDCIKHRDHAPDGLGSWLCDGWDRFYSSAAPTLRNLAEDVARERNMIGPLWSPSDWDPEAPCFCGSGRKAKNCHNRSENQLTTA